LTGQNLEVLKLASKCIQEKNMNMIGIIAVLLLAVSSATALTSKKKEDKEKQDEEKKDLIGSLCARQLK